MIKFHIQEKKNKYRTKIIINILKYLKLKIYFYTHNPNKIRINSFKKSNAANKNIFLKYTHMLNPIMNGMIDIVSYFVFFCTKCRLIKGNDYT